MQLITNREEWASRLAEVAQRSHPNESSLRHALYTVFYPYLREEIGLEDSDIHHERSSGSGRYDSLFSGTLIEYKSPGELDTLSKRRIHSSQALRYLDDEQIGADVVILTDGLTWGILRDSSGPQVGEQTWLDFGEPIAVPPEGRFQWRANSQDTARRVLDLLDTVRYEAVTTHSLMRRMGPTSSTAASMLAALSETLLNRDPNSRTDILYRQWLQLAGVSYGISQHHAPWPDSREKVLGDLNDLLPNAGYAESIYLLHTYIALCSKLMAAETLALSRSSHDKRPSQWISLNSKDFVFQLVRLEEGVLAEEMQAPRLMGGDLFGWYADEMGGNKSLERATRELFSSFSQLAWARFTQATHVTGDILRDFYIGIVPRQMRKALGEFFTPEWIAERVVGQAVALSGKAANEPARFLDPTCGSGTFLVAALRRSIAVGAALGLEPAERAIKAIDSVYGFDINPVSPLMARVNLLLALGELAEHLGHISFNVYQADSILIPEEHIGEVRLDEADSALKVPLVIGNILLPRSLATLPAISGLARIIDTSLQRGRSREIFEGRLQAEFPEMGIHADDYEEALQAAHTIYAQLKKLHEEGRDGVWAHVIEQSFAPRVMQEVDIVVGNPPWISWKHLPPLWRDRSELTWRQWGLWQTKKLGGGTPMADISTLLLARCIATYAPKGLIALLLPEGILLNEPGGRAIRSCVLSGDSIVDGKRHIFQPLMVDDFSSLNPFPDASNRPIALYVQANAAASFPISSVKWERARKRVSLPVDQPLRAVLTDLSVSNVELSPIDERDIASKWRPARGDIEFLVQAGPTSRGYTWGQGFHTRGADGIFYCEVLSSRPLPGGLVRILSRPDLGRNTKADVDPVEAVVEAKFLWPLIRGASVHAFQVEHTNLYCIVPHDPSSPSKIMTVSQMIQQGPHLYDYLEPHIERLLNRSAYDMKLTPEQPWGIQGTAWKHMQRGAHLVVARYMHPDKRPPAAASLMSADAALGLNTTAYPNNKVNFVSCRSVEEADYLTAFVNSDAVQSNIARVSSTTTISPSSMNKLPIPYFDSSEPNHRLLSSLGLECRDNPSLWSSLAQEAQELVKKIVED